MGTRGAFGFRIDGEDKITYNPYDSYPSGLGEDIVTFLRTANLEKVREKARSIEIVNQDVPPTPEQIDKYQKYANTGVSTGQLDEWYVLLRNLQGGVEDFLEAGVMIGSRDFMFDSLFCEWAYVVNLDDNVLEVYQGFQKNPHELGRYGIEGLKELEHRTDQYYPVALLATLPLDDLPFENLGEVIQFDEDVDDYVVKRYESVREVHATVLDQLRKGRTPEDVLAQIEEALSDFKKELQESVEN